MNEKFLLSNEWLRDYLFYKIWLTETNDMKVDDLRESLEALSVEEIANQRDQGFDLRSSLWFHVTLHGHVSAQDNLEYDGENVPVALFEGGSPAPNIFSGLWQDLLLYEDTEKAIAVRSQMCQEFLAWIGEGREFADETHRYVPQRIFCESSNMYATWSTESIDFPSQEELRSRRESTMELC